MPTFQTSMRTCPQGLGDALRIGADFRSIDKSGLAVGQDLAPVDENMLYVAPAPIVRQGAERFELRDILRTVGATTLVVTHDQIEAIGLADRIALMNNGRIVQVGTAREIYDGPATEFIAEFIGSRSGFQAV